MKILCVKCLLHKNENRNSAKKQGTEVVSESLIVGGRDEFLVTPNPLSLANQGALDMVNDSLKQKSRWQAEEDTEDAHLALYVHITLLHSYACNTCVYTTYTHKHTHLCTHTFSDIYIFIHQTEPFSSDNLCLAS